MTSFTPAVPATPYLARMAELEEMYAEALERAAWWTAAKLMREMIELAAGERTA